MRSKTGVPTVFTSINVPIQADSRPHLIPQSIHDTCLHFISFYCLLVGADSSPVLADPCSDGQPVSSRMRGGLGDMAIQLPVLPQNCDLETESSSQI